jgi:uncharacterized protein YpuA (DUF1002 family)
MAGKTLKTIKSHREPPEKIVERLKKVIGSLKNNYAIYENDMARCLNELKDKYQIDSIEEAVAKIKELDMKLEKSEKELTKVTDKIATALRSYDE